MVTSWSLIRSVQPSCECSIGLLLTAEFNCLILMKILFHCTGCDICQQAGEWRAADTVDVSPQVSFKADDGKPMAICQVNVEPTPHVVNQTFRLYHPELCFLKKAIRLPPWHDPTGGDGYPQLSPVSHCSAVPWLPSVLP